ncbi:MAG TPA: NUDIX domain-containing protein, partial [Verrucomicrobiae bacterium]
FLARSQAEHDESFKQIIPYVAICHGSMHLLLRRTAKQTEARLHDKLSLGIGGHINEIELTNAGADLVRAGMLRELDEEVELKGDYEVRPVGVIYDGSNPVGRVHLGLAFRVECKGSDFTLKEPDLMTGEWVPREKLKEFFPAMESWSQHLVTGLFS